MIENVRASDRITSDDIKREDFTIRRRTPAARMVKALFMIAVIAMGVTLIVYNNTLTGAGICVVVGAVMLGIGRQMERVQQIQQATEFMNALFSSALGKGYAFCTVIREDGEIVYLNRSFQEMFPKFLEQKERTLQALFAKYGAQEDSVAGLLALVQQNNHGSVPVNLTLEDGSARSFHMMIEMIDRPAGFALLRAT